MTLYYSVSVDHVPAIELKRQDNVKFAMMEINYIWIP